MNEGLKQLGLILFGVALTIGVLFFHGLSLRVSNVENMHNNLVKILVQQGKLGNPEMTSPVPMDKQVPAVDTKGKKKGNK